MMPYVIGAAALLLFKNSMQHKQTLEQELEKAQEKHKRDVEKSRLSANQITAEDLEWMDVEDKMATIVFDELTDDYNKVVTEAPDILNDPENIGLQEWLYYDQGIANETNLWIDEHRWLGQASDNPHRLIYP